MTKFQLANGKAIDMMMVEDAMDDSNREHLYFLNTETGEVVFVPPFDGGPEREELLEEIDGSDHYVDIERISSHEAYQWMEDFVEQIVAPQNEFVAEKLSIALMGRGAFRRFRDVLDMSGDKWVQAWYRWRDDRLGEARDEWFEGLVGIVVKVEG